MKNVIRISVQKPCLEKFENFSQTSAGGFCGSCQVDVIDFTAMTSEELIKHFSKTSGKTCGRFKKSQLKMHVPTMKSQTSTRLVSRGIAVLSFSLLSLCAVSNLQAQEVASIEKPTLTEASMVMGKTIVMGDVSIQDYSVKGTVLDEENTPLAGVNVVLKGTIEGVVTDFDGKFEFPRKLEIDDTLLFSYIGYETKEYKVSSNESDNININIKFDASDIFLMGAVEVAGVYESKPTIFQKFIALFK